MSLFDKLKKKARERLFCSAVIVAAGSSERMGFDKILAPLCGRPVIAWTLLAFEKCERVSEIIIVTQPEKIVDIAHICRDHGITKATKILAGGETRVCSTLAGLSEIDERAKLAAIHDGDRPLVTPEIISEAVHAGAMYRAAAPAIPLKDTVKLSENGVVTDTPPRDTLSAVQTPQVFDPDILKAALTDVVRKELSVTDDCAAVALLGVKAHLTRGSEENIKLTTPLDMRLAETILKGRCPE